MNKRKRELLRSQSAKKRTRRLLWLGCGIAIIGIIVSMLLHKGRNDDRKAWDESTEGRLLQSASLTQIDQRFRPVLIYRYRGANRPAFTAVGTAFEGRNGTAIVTVEHLLIKKFVDELFVLRYLSPDLHQVTNGIQSIASRNVDIGLPADMDVVFVKPGDPARIECFSDKTEGVPETAKVFFFDNVQVGGKVLKSLKSLITGKEYSVIGASKNPQFILISYASQAGESGSGFIDEYGGLYVLSGGTREGTRPVSFLSGPLVNIEKHF